MSTTFKTYEVDAVYRDMITATEYVDLQYPKVRFQSSSWQDGVGSKIDKKMKKRMESQEKSLRFEWERLEKYADFFSPEPVMYQSQAVEIKKMCVE